ncbi:Oxidoreductase FAD-binding domain protein [Segniliparus rotundus DSM 44985]|uniref:nitric oxide dioxygenase n=1 Tax=Segniliparus rotundus (strain ATCC BAA-972 / CDC 1076 / CIP 108378 / DSM 44985 / JCM 13578) TaxID=640132 RepID=D6ZBY8_SEGRD|nr:globin domain-containing protein [Segniliparus rotundus]ADG96965.1 Oxidoreductase FAD-binding domain protein [Segniliparus rotundus DSM 44985]
MSLSDQAKSVLRATAPAVGAALDEIAPLFYDRLFAAHPELLRDLFNRGNQAQGDQPKALAGSIVAFAGLALAGDEDRYGAVLDRIAHKHASLGVTAELYSVVHEHLFAAIAQVLGEAVTPEVASAWTELYWLMAGELIARERGLYDAARVAPGEVWREARVAARALESADVVSLELVDPSGAGLPAFLPGQYVSVQVALPDGARQIRQYSLAGGTSEGSWRLGVKRVRGEAGAPDGEVSNHIYENVFEGDLVRVSIPAGELVLDRSDRPLVLVSAGIGCTPIMGMLHALAAERSERSTTVLHADRALSTHAYRAELADLVGQLPNGRLWTWYQSLDGSRRGALSGLMDFDAVDVAPDAVAYVCGPTPFLGYAVSALTAKGLSEADVRYEVFGPLAALVAA